MIAAAPKSRKDIRPCPAGAKQPETLDGGASAVPVSQDQVVQGVEKPVCEHKGKTSLQPGIKALGYALLVLVLILVGYNILLDRVAAKSQRRQLLSLLKQLPARTDCIFLGNSLVEAGCDCDAIKAAWPDTSQSIVPVNLALGGTSPVEHYLILKRALQNQVIKPKLLIYGFFDDQLNAEVRGDWSDLIGNRAFSYYFPREAAALYAPGSWLKRWQLYIAGALPMLSERSTIWTAVELLRRRFEDLGMPQRKTNRYGRVEDFSALEAADIDAFNRRCTTILASQSGFSTPVSKIMELGQRRGMQVILLEMPLPSRHRTTFYASPRWSDLRQRLQSLATDQGAIYLSASDWSPNDEDFEDATHLNSQGAKIFSQRLAREIQNIKR